jgi:hypothetical protein
METKTEKKKPKCCGDLVQFKEEYEKLRVKYKLPEFSKFAEDFDIERVVVEQEVTDFLIRNFRRIVNEKITAYLHFFETLMNPGAAPLFVIYMLKNATEEDKKKIEEIYKKLAKLEIGLIRLDSIYNEKNEAEFINKVYKEWQTLKVDINDLVTRFDDHFDFVNKEVKKGYFG